MQNLNLLQDALKNNGQALAYQFLDGMNWKQHTYSDIKHSLDNTIAYLFTNGFAYRSLDTDFNGQWIWIRKFQKSDCNKI